MCFSFFVFFCFSWLLASVASGFCGFWFSWLSCFCGFWLLWLLWLLAFWPIHLSVYIYLSFFLFGSCSPFSFCICFSCCFRCRDETKQGSKQGSKQASTSCSPLDLVCCWGPPPTPPAPRNLHFIPDTRACHENQYFKVNSPVQNFLTKQICLLCLSIYLSIYLSNQASAWQPPTPREVDGLGLMG